MGFKKAVANSLINLLLLALVVLIGCNDDKTAQDPKYIFSDGQLPSMLDDMANQTHELRRLSSQIRTRVEQDRQLGDTIEVAVIDSGVDFAHPDLVDQIAFDLDSNGRVVGAGYDALGGDRFASGRLINPALFAFGATSVNEGVIHEPPKNPLELVKRFNESFIAELTKAIQEDPVLSKSLFAKIDIRAINLFGAEWWTNVENTDNGFDIDKYNELKRQGRLYRADLTREEATSLDMDPVNYSAAVHEPWFQHQDIGLPGFIGADNWVSEATGINSVEHADRFFQAVKRATQEFPGAQEYQRSKATLVSFIEEIELRGGANDEAKLERAARQLSRASYFKQFGSRANDPVYEVNRLIHEFHVRSDFLRGEFKKTGLEFPKIFAGETPIEVYHSFIDGLLKHIKSNELELSPTEQYQIQRLEERLEGIKALSNWIVEERLIGEDGLINPDKETPQSSLNRRHLIYRHHPFAHTESEASHGTHVARTISRQNEKIRIYPVRVLTGGLRVPKKDRLKLRTSMFQEMEEWLSHPVVFRGLADRAGELFPYLRAADENIESRRLACRRFFEDMKTTMVIGFSKEFNLFEFVRQFEEAVKHIGERKIPFANVSLGGEMNTDTASLANKEKQGKMQELFALLSSEFNKYKIGKAVKENAAETLFFIAMGNSNAWVDGQSRSAIPVDPSSQWLKPFERPELGETVPNNHVPNIVGVGSLAPNGQLSSFTNVPLGQDPPVVFVRGEQVYASVARTDLKGTRELLHHYALDSFSLNPLNSLRDQRVLDYIATLSGLDSVTDERRRKYLEARVNGLFNYLEMAHSKLKEILVLHLSRTVPDLGALMNGTSMASPHALGQAANMYLNQLAGSEQGRFEPRAVLDALLKDSDRVLKDQLRVDLPKLPEGDVGDQEAENRPLAIALKGIFGGNLGCVESLR